MTFRMNDLLRTSMESAQPREPVAVRVVSAEDADTAVLDMLEARASLEATNNDYERVQEAMLGLEEVALALESFHAEGGLSPEAAALTNRSIQTHCAGARVDAPLCVSTEAFSGPKRQHATSLSMEAVSAQVEQIWQKLKDILAKVYEAVMAFLKRIFSAATALKERAEKAEQAASGLTGSPAELKFDDVDLANALAVNTEVEARPTQNLTDLSKLADEFVGAGGFGGRMTQLAEDLGRFAITLKGTQGEAFNAKALAAYKFSIPVPACFTQSVKASSAGIAKASDVLPGGKQFVLTMPDHSDEKGADGATEHVNRIVQLTQFHVQDFEHRGEVKAEVPTLVASEINAISKLVIEVLGKIEEYQNEKSKIDGERKQTIAEFDQMAKEAVGSDHAGMMVGLCRAYGAVDRIGNVAVAKVAGYITQTCRSYIAYVEKSISQYAPKEAPKADETKAEPVAA